MKKLNGIRQYIRKAIGKRSNTTTVAYGKVNDRLAQDVLSSTDGMVVEVVSKGRGALQFKNAIGVSEEKYQKEVKPEYKKRNNVNSEGNRNGSRQTPRDTIVSFGNSIPRSKRTVNKKDPTKTVKELVERQ